MYRVKKFKVFENERMFGVGDIDYIESFTEIFNIITNMKKQNLINDQGILNIDVDEVGTTVPEFDDLFDTESDYYEVLSVVKDIIDKYYKKI